MSRESKLLQNWMKREKRGRTDRADLGGTTYIHAINRPALVESSRYGLVLAGCARTILRPRSLYPRRKGRMPRTILIADDNPLIRKTLCEIFEAEEDYDICAEAANGQEAIDLALKHRPELIILDLSMPVMNGLEASRELKRIMPSVPIILFTLYGDIENEVLAADPLVDKVVSKGEARNLMGYIRSLIPV